MNNPDWRYNPFHREPIHPCFLRRAFHHDYRRPGKYMLTFYASQTLPPLSEIRGDFRVTDSGHPDYATAVPTATGRHVADALALWIEKYPQIKVVEHVVMPDHVHLCVHVWHRIEAGLGTAVSSFTGKTSRLRHDSLPPELRPAELVPFFAKGFNDRIAYYPEMFERQIEYVRDNPRRLLIKRQFPDLYLDVWGIDLGDMSFSARGNLLLLHNPDLQVVRFSRAYSDAEFRSYVNQWKACVRNGGVLVSPFIHPREREMMEYALANGGNVIRICDNGLAVRDAPKGREFENIATAHYLQIAPFERSSHVVKMGYERAQQLNAIARRVAATPWRGGGFTLRRLHR